MTDIDSPDFDLDYATLDEVEEYYNRQDADDAAYLARIMEGRQ